ncbi:serine-type peptidase [Aureococcus anophagefferens]|nr:serine-type peptidase [Aureococcus anophagefferens]
MAALWSPRVAWRETMRGPGSPTRVAEDELVKPQRVQVASWANSLRGDDAPRRGRAAAREPRESGTSLHLVDTVAKQSWTRTLRREQAPATPSRRRRKPPPTAEDVLRRAYARPDRAPPADRAPRPEPAESPAASALPSSRRRGADALKARLRDAEVLSFDDVAHLPKPGTLGLASAKFSPDGSHLTYLASTDQGSMAKALYAYDVATGETSVAFSGGDGATYSLEEQLRRERARVMATGVTSYAWAKKAPKLLVPLEGALYVKEGVNGEATRLFDPADHPDVGSGACLDAKISDDGSTVAFVWDDEVCVCAAGGGAPARLSTGARGTAGLTHGVADYCAMEEMDRYDGLWLSADGTKVCYEACDESAVQVFGIPHAGDADPMSTESHRYPFAGAVNPAVKLGVVAVAGGATAWLDVVGAAGLGHDVYLARVAWADEATVLALVQNRAQTVARLVALDAGGGDARVVLEETNDAWINLDDALRWGVAEGELLLASERGDGVKRLYAHDAATGAELRCVTPGNIMVEELVKVSETEVYFLGSDLSKPLERGLFVAPYGGSETPERLSDAGAYVDAAAVGDGAEDPRVASLAAGLRPPEFVTFPSADGAVELHAAIYAPDAAVHGPGPYPTAVSCYGGPHVQFVADKWSTVSADLRAQKLRSEGFLVVKCDNRGSERRGQPFEAAIRGNLGDLEVADQVSAVDYVVARGLADKDRVGIYGWSYGGYLSAMCLARAPRTFRCAVAGAPVTSWDGCDTHYTERYMAGGPAENPGGYASSSVMTHAADIEGALLLVHGLIDENVHFRHTARLIQALVDEGKAYDLLCFPNERHSPRSEKDRAFMEARVFAFLDTWLRQ